MSSDCATNTGGSTSMILDQPIVSPIFALATWFASAERITEILGGVLQSVVMVAMTLVSLASGLIAIYKFVVQIRHARRAKAAKEARKSFLPPGWDKRL